MSRIVSLLARLFNLAFLLVMILHTVTSGTVTRVDTTNFQNIDLYDNNENMEKYKYEPNITNVNIIEDNDPDYPYEKLLQIVKETKMLLRSQNITEKKEKLKLDPSVYQNYLNGDFSDSIYDFPTSNAVPAYAGHASAGYGDEYKCRIEVAYILPRRMRDVDGSDQYILNLGASFQQKVNTVKCRTFGKPCGNPSTWPENYEKFCEQQFGRRKKLISIPALKELSLSEQKEREFEIPDKCACSLRRRRLIK